MISVEVQASGRPVIAFRSGGSLETVIEDQTGIFFDHQDVEALCAAMLRFEKMEFDPELIRKNTMRFDQAVFESKVRACIKRFE
jgi:glycosyltransferase involved in cell wall biosynthesis